MEENEVLELSLEDSIEEEKEEKPNSTSKPRKTRKNELYNLRIKEIMNYLESGLSDDDIVATLGMWLSVREIKKLIEEARVELSKPLPLDERVYKAEDRIKFVETKVDALSIKLAELEGHVKGTILELNDWMKQLKQKMGDK